MNPLTQLSPTTQILPQQALNLLTPPLQQHKTLQELRAITDLLRSLPKPTPLSSPMHIDLYRIFHGKYLLPANFNDLQPDLYLLIVTQFSFKLLQSLATSINRFLKRMALKHPDTYPPKLFNLCQVICQAYKTKKAEAYRKNQLNQPYYHKPTANPNT